MAREYKYRPRTKFQNIKLHHFRDYVGRREISIHKVSTHDQHAYYLTKPINEATHIMYKGFPVLHKSQLQTDILLSSTESKYMGLSYALREAIPIMRILN